MSIKLSCCWIIFLLLLEVCLLTRWSSQLDSLTSSITWWGNYDMLSLSRFCCFGAIMSSRYSPSTSLSMISIKFRHIWLTPKPGLQGNLSNSTLIKSGFARFFGICSYCTSSTKLTYGGTLGYSLVNSSWTVKKWPLYGSSKGPLKVMRHALESCTWRLSFLACASRMTFASFWSLSSIYCDSRKFKSLVLSCELIPDSEESSLLSSSDWFSLLVDLFLSLFCKLF